jgi:putative addiction module component (TIGR02574 family)
VAEAVRFIVRAIYCALKRSTPMADPVADLVKRGRALPPEDRERLVDGLLESLNEPAADALDASWEAEIERRLAEYDQGKVAAIDAEEVFAKARHLAK